MNYNVCPCQICLKYIQIASLADAVYWAPKPPFKTFWGGFWAGAFDDERVVFAHKHCWKRLDEHRREDIRELSAKSWRPRSEDQHI